MLRHAVCCTFHRTTMPPWTRVQGLNQDEAFTRPLGVCSGISDTLLQVTFETSASDVSSLGLLSSQNVARAWLATKKLHPLLGARVHERPDASGLDFVVDEAHLNAVSSDEIMFETLQSDEEACALVDKLMNGSRRLAMGQLVRLWIISLHRSPSTSPSSTSYQLFLYMGHSIHDGVAQTTIVRTFFDILARPSSSDMYIPKDNLETRLMLHLPMDDLNPSRKYSIARQRWRFAIAQVVHSNKAAAWKGGHALPRTITPLRPENLPLSRTFRHQLSEELVNRVLKSCRQAGITFGHALPVLVQLAYARILHRLYAQGALSEAEWTHRIAQPMHFSGPLNLRPYLDPEWLATGERAVNTLPAMPVARTLPRGSLALENPPFDTLLSKGRFLHRCRIAKKQTSDFLNHPLQTEFAQILRLPKLRKARSNALNWRTQLAATRTKGTQGRNLPLGTTVPEIALDEHIMAMSNSCSTLGDLTTKVPAEYPLNGPPSLGRLRLSSIRHYLRCRSAELYLTSVSYRHKLQLVAFCDTRAYGETLVPEWLSNLGQAIEWYLGGTEIQTARL
ncbi:hypothetical protein JB92DRAFT_2912691 [Gautieria morchelliformis]|nr:hypothetical protein JB92DRAFT_2912691 [Gautieria morchelliformis]